MTPTPFERDSADDLPDLVDQRLRRVAEQQMGVLKKKTSYQFVEITGLPAVARTVRESSQSRKVEQAGE